MFLWKGTTMSWMIRLQTLLLVMALGLPAFAQDSHRGPRGAEAGGDRPGRPHRGHVDAPKDDPHWHARRDRVEPMSEAQVREAVLVLRQIDPEKADLLEEAIDRDPENTARILHERFPKLGRFMAWKKYDPTGFDLHVQDIALTRRTHACARRLNEALDDSDDVSAGLEHLQLEDLVSQHFDIRQQIREHELARFEERIDQLHTQLEERISSRDDLIAQRIEELVDGGSNEPW